MGLELRARWPASVTALFTGKLSPDALTAKLTRMDPEARKNRLCEADVYLGERYLLGHNTRGARASFRTAQRECPGISTESLGSVVELEWL